MTAALQLSTELARRLRGKCRFINGGVLAKDGELHADCATCAAQCGDFQDLGLAEAGFVITKDWRGLQLRWACPACGCDVYEEATVFSVLRDAARISKDGSCTKCRATHNAELKGAAQQRPL